MNTNGTKRFEIDADNTGELNGFPFHAEYETPEEAFAAARELWDKGYCAVNIYLWDYTYEQFEKKKRDKIAIQ